MRNGESKPDSLFGVSYDPNGRMWYDIGAFSPYSWGDSSTGVEQSFPTTANLQTQYFFLSDGSLAMSFVDPYYSGYVLPEPIVESTTTYQNIGWEDVSVNPGHSYKITLYGQDGGWGSEHTSRNPDCQPPGNGAVLTCVIKLPLNVEKLRIHTSLGETNKGNFGGKGGKCSQLIIIYNDGSDAECVAVAGGGGGGGHGNATAYGGNAGGFTGVTPDNELAGGGGGWNYNGVGDAPAPSATRIAGEDGVLYGNGGSGNDNQYGGAGGSGWYGGGSSGTLGYANHAGGGGASSFVGRYSNGGVWVAHQDYTTITNGLEDGINGIKYYNVTKFEAHNLVVNDGYAIIESGQAIEDQT